MRASPAMRAISMIEELPEGCWLWTGQISSGGYGRAYVRPRVSLQAHRVIYEGMVGEIPEGLDLDHLCRNRRCVNPSHLEPVTRRVNLLRGDTIPAAHASKTHCPKGHPYDPKNTRVHNGSRVCRACTRERHAAWQRSPVGREWHTAYVRARRQRQRDAGERVV